MSRKAKGTVRPAYSPPPIKGLLPQRDKRQKIRSGALRRLYRGVMVAEKIEGKEGGEKYIEPSALKKQEEPRGTSKTFGHHLFRFSESF